MATIFISGSGTDVGKTFVTCLLLSHLRRMGYRPLALKPVATGFDRLRPFDSDAGRLLEAMGLAVTDANIDRISPWRFAEALSPDMAAAREGRSIPFSRLIDFCKSANEEQITLIEGIGGIMVPLDGTHTVLDWIEELDAPVVLVAGSYLGTLSHTLSAARVLTDHGGRLAGIVVDESPRQPVSAGETAATIGRFVAAPVLTLARDGAIAEAPDLAALLTPYL